MKTKKTLPLKLEKMSRTDALALGAPKFRQFTNLQG